MKSEADSVFIMVQSPFVSLSSKEHAEALAEEPEH
jgi:hypothetical protein